MKSIFSFGMALIVINTFVYAQDFGYEYYSVLDFRSVGVNYSLQNFTPRPSNSLPDSQRISFATNLPFIEYRELGMRIAIGYQAYTIADRSKNSLSVYAESGNDFSLSGKAARSGFFIPVVVSANYVKAESGIFGAKNFDIGSLGVGTGLKYRYMTSTFGFEIDGVAAFHYATEGFSVEYGSSQSYTTETQVILPNLLLNGIVAGYRFQYQSWNMSNAIFDYSRYYHGPFIGILF